MHCPDDELLLRYVDGDLGPAATDAIDRHVDGCSTCADLVAHAVREQRPTARLGPMVPTTSAARVELAAWREVPSTVGRYLVLERIGHGGMGVVHAAYDPRLDRKVAIKLIRRDTGDPEGDRRLASEARALATIAHPNVVAVFEVGNVYATEAARPATYIAMELVDGSTLRAWCRSRSVAEIVAAYVEAGRGLAAAHAVGLVHRDFKPDNVLVGRDGRPRVTDFGLAALVHGTGDAAVSTGSSGSGSSVAGTPGYMAPEQQRGQFDARTDQFAFCVALLEAVTGEHPGSDPHGRTDRLPRRIRHAVRRGLASDPAARHADMEALLAALRAPSPPRASGGAMGLIGCAGLGALLVLRPSAPTPCPLTERSLELALDDRIDALRRRATGEPLVADALARVEPWFAAWRLELPGQCPTPDGPGASCLDAALVELDEVLALLEHNARVDPDVLSAAWALPEPRRCRDATDHDRGAASTRRAEVVRVRRDLARAHALLGADRPGDARALTGFALLEARRIAHPPLVASATLEHGRALWREGGYLAAVEALDEAYTLGMANDLPEIAAESAITQVFLHAAFLEDPAAGWAWERHGAAATARVVGERHDELASDLRVVRGHLRLTEGRAAEALVEFQGAVEAVEARLGPAHPDLITLYNDMGLALADVAGDAALGWYERALELARAVYGEHDPRVAMVVGNIGALHEKRGELDAALAYGERALALEEAIFADAHPRVGLAAYNLGVVQDAIGDDVAARASFRRAFDVWNASLGPDHPYLARALDNLAALDLDSGNPRGAVPLYERSLVLLEQRVGADDLRCITPLAGMAEAALALGEGPRAVMLARRTLAIQRAQDPDPASLFGLEFRLARGLWMTGARAEALDQARRSRDHAEAAGATIERSEVEEQLRVWQASEPSLSVDR